MSLNITKINLVATALKNVNVRSNPGVLATNLIATIKQGTLVGRTSGEYFKMADGDWYVINFYRPINGKTYGYLRSDLFSTTTPAPDQNKNAEAQGASLLNSLVDSDQQLFHGLLRNNERISILKASNVNVSSYESQLNLLTQAYNERQDFIKNSSLVKCSTGFKGSYNWLVNKFTGKNNVNGIGLVGITIAILSVALIGTSVALFYALKPKYDTSKANLVQSAELEKALSTLTPAEKESVLADLEKQIDDTYNKGKSDGSSGTLMGTVKILGMVAIGVFVAINFLK